MIKLIKLNLIIGVLILFVACATSMSPMKFNSTLPTLTKSKFISKAQAEEIIKTNKCKYLVRGRTYNAPLGLTVSEDLKNGAIGIDEWVKLDGGNAYVLISYNWVIVDPFGSTQLQIVFDTMICE